MRGFEIPVARAQGIVAWQLEAVGQFEFVSVRTVYVREDRVE